MVDFAKLFSIELPMFTLREMLGVDEEDRADIIMWMHYLELAPQFITHPFRMLLAEPSFLFRFEKILHDMFEATVSGSWRTASAAPARIC